MTAMLHVGDFDASGLAVFDSAAEDVAQMVADLGKPDIIEFHRVAITEEQIEHYALPAAAPKATDKRGGWIAQTVQADALRPDDLAAEVDAVIRGLINLEAHAEVVRVEAEEREQLIAMLDGLGTTHSEPMP